MARTAKQEEQSEIDAPTTLNDENESCISKDSPFAQLPKTFSPGTTPELLAPAGDMTCLHAAVTAGADAVYLGLDRFNARRNASNFTLETLKEACDYAHLRNVRVYVSMNVEILPSELESALSYARKAYKAGADALILQDIGLITEIRRTLPECPLHLSTQMNIHNAAGLELAAILGAKRVTLARELSLEEIAELSAIAHGLNLELECFAHGALCVCYSGQCLMSSLIGGRSANRGLCAQACRLPYELHIEGRTDALPAAGEHLLSPKDLCTIDLLDELEQAGVASLKIEGRMKSADYVSEVVATYREALDEHPTNTEHHRARLAEAFSRGFTTAYLESQRGNDIMSYGRPNNRGVQVGRVQGLRGSTALVKTEIDLHAGDLVEFWTNRGHFTARVAKDALADHITAIDVDNVTKKGDRVFRIRNSQTIFTDDSFEPRIPVTGHIQLICEKPLSLSFSTRGETVCCQGPIVEQARTKETSTQDILEHIDRMGQTPFKLEDLQIDKDPGIGIGFSALHRLRSEALNELEQALLDDYRTTHRENTLPSMDIRELIPSSQAPSRAQKDAPFVAAWVTNPSCARAARKSGAQRLYVPILNFRRGEAQLAGVRMQNAEQAGYPKECIMALPTIDHDPLIGTREYDLDYEIWDYVRPDKPVYADSLSDGLRALLMGAQVELGPHVPITNKASLEFIANMGFKRVWLSPELTLGQIADLAENAPLPLGIVVSGAQELMVTEHCMLMSQGACDQNCAQCQRRFKRHYLSDRKGFEFPVVTDALGRSHLYNGIALDACASMMDLIHCGIDGFMVDTTLLGKEEAAKAVRHALRANEIARSDHRAIEKKRGTTTGHLFRGVQ